VDASSATDPQVPAHEAAHGALLGNSVLPANGQVRMVVHEVAHALGSGYRDYGRQQAEVPVDTVTYIVCGGCLRPNLAGVPGRIFWM